MTTPFDFKNINEFFDELNLLRKQAGRVGQLTEDLKASRAREQQLEMRVAALSKGPTMIPGLSTDPWLDKVSALKELCDQKDAANRKLQEALDAAGYEDEDVQRIRDENARLLDDQAITSNRIATLNAALSAQTEKTRKVGDVAERERGFAYGRTHAAFERVFYGPAYKGEAAARDELEALNKLFYERLNSLP